MEALGTLAGGVAHDLNNILTGVMGYPDLLLMDMDPANPMRKPLETIRQSGRKAAAIVQDLLTLARRSVSVEQVVDLNVIVRDYLSSPEHEQLKKHSPQVVFEPILTEQSVCANGSPVHISKTIMNLMANACEAIPGTGIVRISTRRQQLKSPCSGYEVIEPGTYAVLSVSDDGLGITEENLERIFEPFYTKKVLGRSGTGLGLAVVWGTVKDSGGYIDVASRPNQETRFDLYFPSAAKPPETDAAPRRLDDFMGKGEHVLVIDDISEQRVVAAGMLERLGYRVDVAASGEEAVTWMQDRSSDLLLLDMLMDPGIDGLETYRRILSFHPGQSGYSETVRVTQTLAMGPAVYLKKPYTMISLAQTVRSVLSGVALVN